MNAVNAVQLLILGWTFTAVCQADDDDCIICEDVTGTAGEEVSLTCVSQCSECCIKMYKFQYPENNKDSEICKHNNACEQRNSFTCRFTPTTAMTEQIKFFVQTPCGGKKTKFTVTITERSKPEPVTKAPLKTEPSKPDIVTEDHDTKEGPSESETYQHEKAESRGFKVAVIAAAVSCFIIVIMPIIYKIKQNYTQKRMFLENRRENII